MHRKGERCCCCTTVLGWLLSHITTTLHQPLVDSYRIRDIKAEVHERERAARAFATHSAPPERGNWG